MVTEFNASPLSPVGQATIIGGNLSNYLFCGFLRGDTNYIEDTYCVIT